MYTELLTKYIKLNNSFKKKLVFRLGAGSGFFSEYNNMIFSMLYCLKNEIKFELHSIDNNFSPIGWTEYFKPFCDENEQNWHIKYNHSWISPKPSSLRGLFGNYYYLFLSYLNNVDYLTSDIFYIARNQNPKEVFGHNQNFCHGTFMQCCNKLVQLTYRFNNNTQYEIDTRVNSLDLDKYVGFHIRRGDKIKENAFMHTELYIKRAEEETNIRNAFIATDDYEVVEQMRKQYPSWIFSSLTSKEEKGYDQRSYNSSNESEKRSHLLDFFASVDILVNSSVFIGTYSSNVGMFVKMHRIDKPTFAVDFNEWLIW